MNKEEAFKWFIIYYFRYITVLFTRSGYKKLIELVTMFEFFEKYIKILKLN